MGSDVISTFSTFHAFSPSSPIVPFSPRALTETRSQALALFSAMSDGATEGDAIVVSPNDNTLANQETSVHGQPLLKIDFGPLQSPSGTPTRETSPKPRTLSRRSQRLSMPVKRANHSRVSISPQPPSRVSSVEEDQYDHEGILVDISEGKL